ncbi:MAG: drug/metabolite transporter (DMT)-like permease [Aquiluna sp.]|jgi:drug/metabolite transporter (DMT)-like permease
MRDNWVIKFIPLALIWGSSFFFIELSLEWTTAVGVAFWRTALGALAMIIITYSLGLRLPGKAKQWLHLLVAGFFMSAFPFTMYAFAQQYTTSILAAILNATTPMFTLLATFTLFRAQKQNPTAIIGLLVGLVGVGITLGIWRGFGESEPIAILALIAASISYGIGTPYIRKYVTPMKLPATVTASVQVLTSAVILLPVYLFTGPLFVAEPTVQSAGALVLLGVLGSGISYWLFHQVVATAGSAVAATVTYTNPVIATIWGVLLLGEGLHWYEPAGAVLVLTGAFFAQGRRLKLKRQKT